MYSRSSKVPWLKLNWDVPYSHIFREFKSIPKSEFVTQRMCDNHVGWHATTIYGYGSSYTKSHWEYLHLKMKKKITSSGQFCPFSINWINKLPYQRIDDVRFLVVNPGGLIKPHIDVKDQNWLEPVSIAINWPNNCEFKFTSHGTIPFYSGMAVILNVHYEHTVINNSDSPRVVLVIHGKKNERFWKDVL